MRLNHRKGQAAEDAALVFLQGAGCLLVERNWHCPYGEIDLIMRDGAALIFVEVRYRQTRAFGGALASIGTRKLEKLMHSVDYYLAQHHHQGEVRLDAVVLQGNDAPLWLKNLTG